MANSTITVTGPSGAQAMGGGFDGADRINRETVRWQPPRGVAPDVLTNPAKGLADARSTDMLLNDGYTQGGAHTHRDGIVGTTYMLNATPNARVLGVSESWIEGFQDDVENLFNLTAESDGCWFDVNQRFTFTELIRLGIGCFFKSGELAQASEWDRDDLSRPFKTCVRMIAPERISNPNDAADTDTLRRGVETDNNGKIIAYHVRNGYQFDVYGSAGKQYTWKRIPAKLWWGRRQFLHLTDPLQIDQTRGVSDTVAVLQTMKMTKDWRGLALQRAVVDAMYAATLESELPPEKLFEMMGGQTADPGKSWMDMIGHYLTAAQNYAESATNIAVDGVKIPQLLPGTSLNMRALGTPGGVGTDFEASLLRHIASALGLSYEEFARDYTKTNYSSARASMLNTRKFLAGRKKRIADRQAAVIYALWLEEMITSKTVSLPRGRGLDWYFKPYIKDALSSCTWIGSSLGQIDEEKETIAAAMRIEKGLSTEEAEAGKLGGDWRLIKRQRKRELEYEDKIGLTALINKRTKEAAEAAAPPPKVPAAAPPSRTPQDRKPVD